MELIDETLFLTERMLACGQQGDWAQVIDLERERRARLGQLFAVDAAVDGATAQRLRDILDLDRRLIQLGAQVRDAVAAELSNAQLGRKVTRAYHSSGS